MADQTLLTEREVAGIYGLSVFWLRKKRSIGGGPPFLKLPGIRYQRLKLEAWLEAQERYSTADRGRVR